MNFLHADIGSAKDNQRSPVHNWYKFTAGFSYRFVEEIIALEKLKQKENAIVFDPFAGCGTTLVSSQKEGIKAIGNESQAFMFDIIRAKLNWNLEENQFYSYLGAIQVYINRRVKRYNIKKHAHPLLSSLYEEDTLKIIYLLRDSLQIIPQEKYRLFFKLALSQTLHKVSIHPIAIPYIVRSKKLTNKETAWNVFSGISNQMFVDTQSLSNLKAISRIYKHDSRKPNKFVKDSSCDLCITSPPYLNNLDYGEVSKVHTHFFEITSSWNEITKNVRKELVTGSTTHYVNSEFSMDEFLCSEFFISNKNIADQLIKTSRQIKVVATERSGRKSFDILTLYYFQDMYNVLKEIKRVLKPNSKAYLILGDSAPYGIYIPTTELLGKIGENCGFDSFKIHKIRSRGSKWKTLTYRHKVELTENVLVLQ